MKTTVMPVAAPAASSAAPGAARHSGNANTKRLLPLLGVISGVIAVQRDALPPVPVPATTYCRPSTSKVTGALAFELEDSYGQFNIMHMNQDGVIR